jgi:hypothetical protein
MDLFIELARLTRATEGTPLVLGNVEFWIDLSGPWKGQLGFSIPTSQWDAHAIGASVSSLSVVYPEIPSIVARCAN